MSVRQAFGVGHPDDMSAVAEWGWILLLGLAPMCLVSGWASRYLSRNWRNDTPRWFRSLEHSWWISGKVLIWVGVASMVVGGTLLAINAL
jgi:hypothetical protein